MDAWGRDLRQTIEKHARTFEDFSANEILDQIGPPDSTHTANSWNNAIGKAFAEASKAGMIETVGVTKSNQPSRKGGTIRVWRGVPEFFQTKLFG